MGLYETLKAAKIGAASDVFTTLRGRKAPFAKGGSTPTEKELEDTPPLSFTANGEPLIDWIIDGAAGGVGDVTANMCSNSAYKTNYSISAQGVETANTGFNIYSIECSENTEYTLSLSSALSGSTVRVHAYNDDTWIEQVKYSSIANLPISFTTPANTDEVRISITNVANGKIMYNEGGTALPYEPHGKYKIPVACGGETKTIYLDEPLGASDSISMTDTGITIPTVDGSNTLSVGTTVQPSSVYIKYKE